MKSPSVLALVVCSLGVLVVDGSARGDVVTTYDGRRFEGKIIEENASKVRMDAKVAGVRIWLGLSRSEVTSIQKRPLPEGFFEDKPKAAKRVSDREKFKPDTALYIEVPIVGRFGAQVVPAGVRKCLAYAAAHKIPHVVFRIDSQGGDQIAAKEIYDLLEKYDERLEYHAIVRDSVGVAMAVTVWCKNVFILPGANLGGTVLTLQKATYSGNPDIYLSQVAHAVGMTAEKKGWPAGVVRAMIDPSERVAGWAEPTGEVVTGVRVPPGVSRESVIFRAVPGEVLTLTRSGAVAVGIGRQFGGKVEQLGLALGLYSWEKESDYASRTMSQEAIAQQKKQGRAAARTNTTIAKLVKRRDQAKRYTDRYLTLAHKWDPEMNPYAPYSQSSGRWEGYWGGDPIRQTTTRSSYRRVADQTVVYLRAAYKGITELKRLEAQLARYDVDPLYKEGELDGLHQEIEVKVEYLLVTMNRRAGVLQGSP